VAVRATSWAVHRYVKGGVVTVGWSQDDRNVVTFGRLYLNTLAPTRNYTPPTSKVTWTSRLARALSTSWTKV
jgi:hypothetical protein